MGIGSGDNPGTVDIANDVADGGFGTVFGTGNCDSSEACTVVEGNDGAGARC